MRLLSAYSYTHNKDTLKSEAKPTRMIPHYETYFADREGAHMRDTFRGTKVLRFLRHDQDGRMSRML